MKSILKSFFVFLLIAFINYSCHNRKDDTICTSMFASVSIEVIGSSLDDYFTIRSSTGDTLRFNAEPFQNYYTVLDDNYQKILENKQENFRFVGMKSGNKVIDENFVISADKCHISKVSGKTSVTI